MTTIYCDLDGVIANFVDGAIEAADLPLTHDDVNQWDFFKPYMSAEHFWGCVHTQSCFWEDLPVYPWAHELVEALRSFGDVVYCSDPTLDDESATGKIKWLKRHGFVRPGERNYILAAEKWRLSQSGVILLDDSPVNCRRFYTGGNGLSIQFPQRWNDSFGYSTVNPVLAVVSELKTIWGLGRGMS